jgi:hypothetical protein
MVVISTLTFKFVITSVHTRYSKNYDCILYLWCWFAFIKIKITSVKRFTVLGLFWVHANISAHSLQYKLQLYSLFTGWLFCFDCSKNYACKKSTVLGLFQFPENISVHSLKYKLQLYFLFTVLLCFHYSKNYKYKKIYNSRFVLSSW